MTTDSPELAAFRETFHLDELTLHTSSGWVLSVRPQQITLGSMVVSHQGGALDFGSLGPGDGDGFVEVVALAERAATGLYGAVRLNVICLMMRDPVVHFHILPRYAHPVERHGRHWVDSDWPSAPTVAPAPTPADLLDAITTELRAEVAGAGAGRTT